MLRERRRGRPRLRPRPAEGDRARRIPRRRRRRCRASRVLIQGFVFWREPIFFFCFRSALLSSSLRRRRKTFLQPFIGGRGYAWRRDCRRGRLGSSACACACAWAPEAASRGRERGRRRGALCESQNSASLGRRSALASLGASSAPSFYPQQKAPPAPQVTTPTVTHTSPDPCDLALVVCEAAAAAGGRGRRPITDPSLHQKERDSVMAPATGRRRRLLKVILLGDSG